MNKSVFIFLITIMFLGLISCENRNNSNVKTSSLSPENWIEDYNFYLKQLGNKPTREAAAAGKHGAIAVGYHGVASRAGMEALKQGGNAIDAALTTALTQIAVDGGSVISYFGVMNMVYYEASTGEIHTMNAGWNSIINEKDPKSIPSGMPDPFSDAGDNREPSGRTGLVGGFIKGVEEAHQRFGKLPFQELFKPAIYVAENGFEMYEELSFGLQARKADLGRLSETKSLFFKSNDSLYQTGDLFKQTALAKTLSKIADKGSSYMYEGQWGKKLVRAIQNDGGYMTMDDLKNYSVIWGEPLVVEIGDYKLHTTEDNGGKLMIEALNLAKSSGLTKEPHWTKSSESLKKALTITETTMAFDFMSESKYESLFPGLERNDRTRITQVYADSIWNRLENGVHVRDWISQDYKSSDVVVAMDSAGNVAVIDHSIFTVVYGKTAISIDGVSISDAGSLLRNQIAEIPPGGRVKAISKIGILSKDNIPVLGFASKGGGMHHRSFQGLMNFIYHNMPIDEAVSTPDFFTAGRDTKTGERYIRVEIDKYDENILKGTGWYYEEIPMKDARSNGEGVWIGVTFDPKYKEFKAASHTRGNGASTAY